VVGQILSVSDRRDRRLGGRRTGAVSGPYRNSRIITDVPRPMTASGCTPRS